MASHPFPCLHSFPAPALYCLHYFNNFENVFVRLPGVHDMRMLDVIEDALGEGSPAPVGYEERCLRGLLFTLEQMETPSTKLVILAGKIRGLLGAVQMMQPSFECHDNLKFFDAEDATPLPLPLFERSDFFPLDARALLKTMQDISYANGWKVILMGSFSNYLYLPRDMEFILYLARTTSVLQMGKGGSTVDSVKNALSLAGLDPQYRLVERCGVIHCTFKGRSIDISIGDKSPGDDTNQGVYFTTFIAACISSVPDYGSLLNCVRLLLGGRAPHSRLGFEARNMPSTGLSLFCQYFFKLWWRSTGNKPTLILPTNKVCSGSGGKIGFRKMLSSLCGFIDVLLAKFDTAPSDSSKIEITLYASGGGNKANPGRGRIITTSTPPPPASSIFVPVVQQRILKLEMAGFSTGDHFITVPHFDIIGAYLRDATLLYLNEGVVKGASLTLIETSLSPSPPLTFITPVLIPPSSPSTSVLTPTPSLYPSTS